MKSRHFLPFRVAMQVIALLVLLATLGVAMPAHAAVPGAPTPRSAFPEKNARATILFTAPESDGGSAITEYTVTAMPGNLTATGAASPITIDGLGIGTSYTLTVTATNSAGTGPPSWSMTVKARPYAPTTGTINNLAVFIRFSDQPEFTRSASYYDGLFNTASNSLRNFYLENSYNALTVNSTLLPSPSGDAIVSYQDSHPTAYYQPYNASTNPIGYQVVEKAARETDLVTNALNAVGAQIPGGLNLDGDGDGYIDHISFEVYSTDSNPLPGMFFSRATYDTSSAVVINGLKVGAYTWATASQDVLSLPLGATEIHEMGHSFGYPDLRGNTGRTPVGNHDVMSISTAATHSGAYEKFRFTNWIASIPEISAYGEYTINDLTQSTNNAYKIQLANTNEFLILEYRKASGQFESHLPGSGLCVTRVNESAGMWGNQGGPPFFLYYFRVDGTLAGDGVGANFTCLSAETGRTQLNDNSNPFCFRSDGSPCGINIYNVGSASGTSISFSLGDPSAATVNRVISGYLYNGGNRVSGATVTLSGDAGGEAITDSLGRYLFVVDNGGNYTVTPSKINLSFNPVSVAYSNLTSDQVQNYPATNNTNTISGTVTSGGQPVSGVAVTCTGGNYPAPVITDVNGNYAFTVHAGGDYVVRPTKTNYFFAPTTKTLTNVTTNLVGQDFSTSSANVTLSGTITLIGNPLSGVEVSAPGANTASPITTGGPGTYSFTVTIGNGSTYTVTPASALYEFSPSNIFYSGIVGNQVGNFTATVLAALPTATTIAGDGIGAAGATLNGIVTANGAATAVSFDYGTSIAYGGSGAATPSNLAANLSSTVALAVSGLSCNTTYHFRVNAVNVAGTSHGTDLSFATLACAGSVPGAPTINSATPGPSKATIGFSTPAANGGSPITAYAVTCSAAGRPSRSSSGAASPITVPGLQGGVGYSCSVAAINGVGTGASSAAIAVQAGKNVSLMPVLMLLLD